MVAGDYYKDEVRQEDLGNAALIKYINTEKAGW